MSDEPSIAKHPLSLLVQPNKIKNGKPWEIDITDLLDLFVDHVIKGNYNDLKLCGTAALSSSIIYRFKVETMFFFEKMKKEKKYVSRRGDNPPKLIILPFRYELYSTSIDDLVFTLEEILKDAIRKSFNETEKSQLSELSGAPDIDEFIVKIEAMVHDFRLELKKLLDENQEILFTDLIKGKELLDQARSFILLLFVANEGNIDLDQEYNDIKIRVV